MRLFFKRASAQGLVYGLSIGLALAWTMGASAQGYPTGPISLVVPFAAGSGTDAVARTVGQKLSERLKQAVVIDNKPGASAQLGAVHVAKAKPDDDKHLAFCEPEPV